MSDRQTEAVAYIAAPGYVGVRIGERNGHAMMVNLTPAEATALRDQLLAAIGATSGSLDEMTQRATKALEAEVEKRNEWYGLDNWTFEEVAAVVLRAALGPAA